MQTQTLVFERVSQDEHNSAFLDEVERLMTLSPDGGISVNDPPPELSEKALELWPETAKAKWDPKLWRVKSWASHEPALAAQYEPAEPADDVPDEDWDPSELDLSQPKPWDDEALQATPPNFPSWVASLEPLQRWGLYKLWRDSSAVRPVYYGPSEFLAQVKSLWPLYPGIWATGAWWARHMCCEVSEVTFAKEVTLGHPVTKTADRPTWTVKFRVKSPTDHTIVLEEFATAGAGAPGQQTIGFQMHAMLRSFASSRQLFDVQWAQLQRLVNATNLSKAAKGAAGATEAPRVSFTMIAAHLALLGSFPSIDPFGNEFNPMVSGTFNLDGRTLADANDSEVSHTCDCAGCVKGIHCLNERHSTNLARVGCPGTVLTVWQGLIIKVTPCPHAWRPVILAEPSGRLVHHTSCSRVVIVPFELPAGVPPPEEWLAAQQTRAANQARMGRLATNAEYWGRIFADRRWGEPGGFKLPTARLVRGPPILVDAAQPGSRLSGSVGRKRKTTEAAISGRAIVADRKRNARVPYAAAALAQAATSGLAGGQIEIERIPPRP